MIQYLLHVAFAGLWAEVWRYGLGTGLIVLCLAAAWFSPVFKKEFCWAAGVIGVFMISFAIGVSTGEKRVQAKWDASVNLAISQGEKARRDAESYVARQPAGGVRSTDKWNRDNR